VARGFKILRRILTMATEALYSVKAPKTLEDMTWEEVSEALDETDVVIIPVGSTEQHGPHLPLATDTIQGVEIAKRTVARLEQDGIRVVAGPAIPFGVAPYHMPFPGTISLHPDTLKAIIKDVCTSLYAHGFRNFALLLAHGGNYAVMQVAAQELVTELPEARVVFLNWLPAAHRHYARLFGTEREGGGHAGQAETAQLLVTHPNLVKMDCAQEYWSREAEEAEDEDHPLLGGAIYEPHGNWRDYAPYGSTGNPVPATTEAGEEVYKVIADWVINAMKRTLLKSHE
jgi:creatinine amidohydrolase